ncbi:MAG: YceI family protein [Verrucomicrobiota bacterium]
MKKTCLILSTLVSALSLQAEVVSYDIDPTHSSVNFAVRHFVNDVNGSFGEFSGTVSVDKEDMSKSSTTAEIKTTSVNTNNAKRDKHLTKDDYFHADKHQLMTFKSTKWEKVDDKNYKVTGDLTLLGTTKPVTMDVEYLGTMDGVGHYEGLEIIGFKGGTEIKRSEWGLDSGGPIVGDDVKVSVSIQGHRKK